MNDLNARTIFNKSAQDYRVLRLPEVLSLMGISRATFYRGVKSGKYPRPLHPSERVSAWPLEEIEALLRKLALRRNSK
ncbi:helix-turn-helix transcriptional regulator [Humidesulfovibrio idahonensis]